MDQGRRSGLTEWLSATNPLTFALFTGSVAFLLYTCVYGFRKSFSVATFDELMFLGVSYKVWLVISQVVGYAVSKFIGIKVVSEMRADRRGGAILALVGVAGLSWLFFALTPAPFNITFLFLNGLPLGMIWGLLFGYLEGRQTTDMLGATLSMSFIFSAGFTKTVGAYLMQEWSVAEEWMPLAACGVFVVPLLGLLWLLERVPMPTALDQKLRTRRVPMDREERWKFLSRFGPGLMLVTIAYMALTAFRDFRDNFSPEIWGSLGYSGAPGIFTTTEIPAAVVVMIVLSGATYIRNNQAGLRANHLIIIAGLLLIGASTLLFERKLIQPATWMALSGTGLYLGYVPFNSVFFERLIAAFRVKGTAGFIMYFADAFGYLGSVGILFLKEFGFQQAGWVRFYVSGAYIVSIAGTVLIVCSLLYFQWKARPPVRSPLPAIEKSGLD